MMHMNDQWGEQMLGLDQEIHRKPSQDAAQSVELFPQESNEGPHQHQPQHQSRWFSGSSC